MKLTVTERFGNKNVYNEDGDCVAVFRDGVSFALYKNGLVYYGGASLYDLDSNEYIVGTVDQLNA